jgi:hypothetical protein
MQPEQWRGSARAALQNQQPKLFELNRLIVSANHSFDFHSLWQRTPRTLSNMDFEHQHEMQRLERSRTDPALKRQIVDILKRMHRERREPYVMLTPEALLFRRAR